MAKELTVLHPLVQKLYFTSFFMAYYIDFRPNVIINDVINLTLFISIMEQPM